MSSEDCVEKNASCSWPQVHTSDTTAKASITTKLPTSAMTAASDVGGVSSAQAKARGAKPESIGNQVIMLHAFREGGRSMQPLVAA